MSQENVEMIRRAFEAYERGDLDRAVADMAPDAVGTWLLHCHVNEHLRGGMSALFTVIPAP